MISARSARNAARIANKKIFRFMPKYFLCGGIAVLNLSLSDGFVDCVVGSALVETFVCSHSGTSTSLSIMDCELALLVMLSALLEAAVVQLRCCRRMYRFLDVPSRVLLHDGMRSVPAVFSKMHLIKQLGGWRYRRHAPYQASSLIVADWEVGIGLARAWTISAQIESRGLHPSYCHEDLSNFIISIYGTWKTMISYLYH